MPDLPGSESADQRDFRNEDWLLGRDGESADQLAEKVRMGWTYEGGLHPEAHAALDALLVRLAEAERQARLRGDGWQRELKRLREAEARLAEAEKERDAKPWIRMRNAANTGDETLYRITADDRIEFGEALKEIRVRFEAAEAERDQARHESEENARIAIRKEDQAGSYKAERDRLKAALEGILSVYASENRAVRIARAVLAADEEGKASADATPFRDRPKMQQIGLADEEANERKGNE